MSNFLRQSTASQSRILGPFIDDTDFKTASTGLTIANTDIKLFVNGAASANKNSGGGTHRTNGMYGVTFDATDTATVGEMEVSVKVAGALQVFKTFYVVEEAVFDALFVASAPGYVVDQPVNVTKLLGTAWLAPGTAGTPDVNVKLWNGLTTVALPLVPTTAGRTLDVSAGGEAGVDWANVGSPTTSLALTGTTIAVTQKVDVETIKTQAVTCAAGVTVLASVGTAATSTAQTGDNFARLGAPAGASVSADIAAAKVDTAAIKVKTDFLPSATAGAAGGVFIAGANAATSITTALTANVIGNVTGNLSGSVGSVTGAVGSVTGNVGGNVTGSVGSIATGGIAAASFAAGAIDAAAIATDAIDADALKADAVTEIQTGLATAANLATVAGYLDTEIAAILADTNELQTDWADGGRLDLLLDAASSAGDPWTTALPGAYGAGTAGKIIGDNINATISSRATQTSVDTIDDFLDTEIAAIKAKTDNLPAAPAAVADIPTAAQNADKLLGRNLAGGADGGRMVKDALRSLRNKTSIAGGTLTVTEEDDTTTAWTATVTTTAGDPLSSIDPA